MSAHGLDRLPSAGELLKTWRQRRRLSQLALASKADVSSRHVSFVETGRSEPSREMILHLASHLLIPHREQNRLLLAAGFAPVFQESAFAAPSLERARRVIAQLFESHSPLPALVADAAWNLIDANRGLSVFFDPESSSPVPGEFNVLRYSLSPDGLAPHIVNLGQWRTHALERLEQQIMVGLGGAEVVALYDEIVRFPDTNRHSAGAAETQTKTRELDGGGVLVPIRVERDGEILSFFTTTTMFATAQDATLQELHVELFYPMDAVTESYLEELTGEPSWLAEPAPGAS